jgi:hypothetical protein
MDKMVAHLYIKSFITNQFLHDSKGLIFVVDVEVIDLTGVTSNVISQPVSATMELNAIIKICMYRGLHEGHHFISIAMEVHDTLGQDTDRFIRECTSLFHYRQSRGQLSLFICIQFS